MTNKTLDFRKSCMKPITQASDYANADVPRIEKPEPFCLSPRDVTAPSVIRIWIIQATAAGSPKEWVNDAELHLQKIICWQKQNPTLVKIPGTKAPESSITKCPHGFGNPGNCGSCRKM